MSGPVSPAVFGRITRRFMEQGFFRGAVLRVEREGEVLHEEAWGCAFVSGEERAAMTPSTIFDLASVSKLFTTTAVLRLVTVGSLRLEASIADILELGLPLRDSLQGVDVRALLTHSSGIRWWFPFYTRRTDPFLSILADVMKEHPRRAEVIYSDLNFMILGLVIERASGMDLPRAVDALVFQPLGLRRTSFARPLGPAAATEQGNRVERRMVADLGLSFDRWRDESKPIVGEPNDGNCHYYFHGAAGHAGIFADAADLCRLGRLFLDKGAAGGIAMLEPGLAEEAVHDHGGGRGLGFQLGDPRPPGVCGHTGFTGTCLAVSPGTGITTVLFTNRLHVPEPRDINPFRREMLEAVVSVFHRRVTGG